MEIKLAEGEAFNVQGGDGLKVNGKDVGGSVDVVAEIAGKEIKPSSVVMENEYRRVSCSVDKPLSIYQEGVALIDCSLLLGLADVTWEIDCEEIGERRVISSYCGKKISLSFENYKNGEYREFDLDNSLGSVSYSGPEGEVKNTIANMANAMPRYPFVDAAIVDGVVTVAPYTNAKLTSDGTVFTVAVGEGGGYARDCVLVVDCGEITPSVIFDDTVFHPRGGDASNLEVVAGKRNVFFITEVQPNVFMVARDELALPDAGGGE